MKKFASMMLGLSLLLGSAAVTFAQDSSKTDTTSTKKTKKSKKSKKTDTTSTEDKKM